MAVRRLGYIDRMTTDERHLQDHDDETQTADNGTPRTPEEVDRGNREAQRAADDEAERLENRATAADHPKEGVFPAPTAAPPAAAEQGGDTDKRPDRQ